jgi:YVTN family beta-propeller protein
VGTLPIGVAVNPKTNTIYVADSGNAAMSLISGRTDTVTATITVGNFPEWVAANPKTNTAYVSNYQDNTASLLASCRPLPAIRHRTSGGRE